MSRDTLLPWEEAELARAVPLVLPTVLPPVDWAVVGGGGRPLELELGYGRPHFLLERAAEVPDHLVVGVEWKARWAHAARKRARRQGLHNVVPLAANAWHVVGGLFARESLSAVWLNFPDPWWKSRHEKRRIVNDAFAHLIAERLVPGGTILVQTDVASLLEQFLEVLEADPLLENPHGAGRLCPRKPTAARSHREKRCVADGVPCFRGLLRRR
jgi:tRNA (guanine-N7-)-methyltransferase